MAQPPGKVLVECFAQPSFLSITECIKSDFLLKSQTDFYIPPEAYGGYSYLNEEPPHGHHHGKHLFVAAEPISGLHPHHMHHHGTFVPFPSHNTSQYGPLHLQSINSHANPHPITIPYIHPELNRPVPPLQLPVYFGVLCFSFMFGGIMMLHWTPKWTRGHWFPYRFFAWALILFQVSIFCRRNGIIDLSSNLSFAGPMLFFSRLCPHDQQFTMASSRPFPSLFPYVTGDDQTLDNETLYSSSSVCLIFSGCHDGHRLFHKEPGITEEFRYRWIHFLALRMALLSYFGYGRGRI